MNTNDDSDKIIKIKSIKYLAMTLIFIMLPYIVKIIAFLFTGLEVDLTDDFRDGSFIMYAISLLAPIWYTVETVFDVGIKKGNNVPVTETIMTIVISMAVYVIFFICNNAKIKVVTVPATFLSIIIMGWSIFLAYRIHKNEITVLPPDSKRTTDENEIKLNMEKIENGETITISHNGIQGELDISNFEMEDDE